MSHRIAIVTAGGTAPAIIIGQLKQNFSNPLLIIEEPESKGTFLIRRAKKIGWFQMLAQLPTQFLAKFIKGALKKRYDEIEGEFDVSMHMPSDIETIQITSVNDGSLGKHITKNDIALVFVVGSRMFSKSTLQNISCPVLNFHGGFTPDYRGLNGGYWARVDNNPERFGGTIHFIDQGVDTGKIVAQVKCQSGSSDNLLTYQHVISAQSAQACVDAIKAVIDGTAKPFAPTGNSKQHYHPTIHNYLWTGLTRKIW